MKMEALSAFLMILIPLVGATMETHGTAYVTGMAELDCDVENFPKDHKVNYYWQKDNLGHSEVLFEIKDGAPTPEHVHNRYLNRSMVSLLNFNLLLYNITMEDKGLYSCYGFIKDPWLKHSHHKIFNLTVKANFSVPVIVPSQKQKVKKQDVIHLECSSRDGSPKPDGVVWIISNSSGSHEISSKFHINQDPVTELLNITSNISLHVEERTNITCAIRSENDLVSDVMEIVPESVIIEPPSVAPSPNNIILYVAIGSVVLFVTALLIYLKRRKKPICQGRQDITAPAEEKQENGHRHEQVELLTVNEMQNRSS
ncbi:T-lymphocyte activation antigen CD86 [Discoglossus pictus]